MKVSFYELTHEVWLKKLRGTLFVNPPFQGFAVSVTAQSDLVIKSH